MPLVVGKGKRKVGLWKNVDHFGLLTEGEKPPYGLPSTLANSGNRPVYETWFWLAIHR